MDATCNVQDSIHVFHLVHNMCPGFWVHITSDQDFFVPSKYQNYYNTVATKLCWCYNIVKCLGQKGVELIGRFLSF